MGADATVNLGSELSKRFRSLDDNGDGLISEAEAEGSADIASSFGAADKDGDGFLTAAEFKVTAEAKSESGGFFRNLFGG